MPQKIKIVLLGLGLISLISLIGNIQTLRSQKQAVQERDATQKQNTALSEEIGRVTQQNSKLEQNIKGLNENIKMLTDEKNRLVQDAEKKLETVKKDRDELLKKLEELKESKPAAVEEVRKQAASYTPAEEAYWAGVLKTKTDLEIQLANVRNELRDSQINYEQAQRDKVNLELELRNDDRQDKELKQQAEYYQKVADNLAQDLVREKGSKIQIENNAKMVKSENSILRRQLKALSERKIDLERKVVDLQQQNTDLESSISQMESMLKDKLFQIDDIRQGMATRQQSGNPAVSLDKPAVSEARESAVELSPIVVRPGQETFAPVVAPQEGEVLLVNKENNFVVVNLGQGAGVKSGDMLNVYRADKEIAAIEAVQIRQNFSACDIKREDIPIKVGDKIR